MIKAVTCSYCGLPFKVRVNSASASGASEQNAVPQRQYFCCTGCAMLSRVPVDEKGQFPVNAHLVSALVTGFLYFNQLLFWLLAVLLARQGNAVLSHRFFWISAAVAIVVWCSVAFVQWRERAARWPDVVALVIALGVHVWAVATSTSIPNIWPMAVANATLIAWSSRGVWRGRKR